MTRQDTCIIVPTIRDHECMRAYYANARAHGYDLARTFTLLVTEDACDVARMREMLRDEGVDGAVVGQRERDEWFREQGIAEHADLIPRRSHAETSFGLLWMQANKEFRTGFFIDDDTLPVEGHDFFGGHERNLSFSGSIPTFSSNTRWVNVLHEGFEEHGLYPRGYPYSAMRERRSAAHAPVRDVVCSQGLWTNVPDLDAVRILMDGNLDGQAETRLDASRFSGEFAVANGNYLTVCSMNLAFKREVIPAFYQLPMDDNPWRIGRFDDIWSGVFLKRAADVLGKGIVTGRPLCQHDKAPRSTFKDLNAEVPALELNEHLWRLVEGAGSDAKSFGEAFRAMAKEIGSAKVGYTYAAFLPYMAERMERWVACVERLA